MLANIRFSKKLALVIGLLSIGLFVVGAVGKHGLDDVWAGLKTVYEDRTVCLGQLSQINDDLSAMRGDFLEMGFVEKGIQERLDDIADKKANIKKVWAEYTGTYLTPEEKVLVDKFDTAYKVLLVASGKASQMINASALEEYRAYQMGEFEKAYDTAKRPIDQLLTLQVDVAKQEYDKAAESAKLSNTLNVAVAIIVIALGAGIGFLIARSITKPLGGMLGVMKQLANGNIHVEVPDAERGDEIGDIAKTVQVFRDNAQAMEKMKADQEAEKKKAEDERKATLVALADTFNREVGTIVDSVSTSAGTLREAATDLSSTAEETSRQSATVAAAAEQASANVQTVASASEELSSSISEIGQRVGDASQIASVAVEEARKTNEIVGKLAASAQKVGEVVGLINEIAAQTNLLALNATIEAARAGDAGKGFAVVASEVKGLANQTARATEDISSQITSIQTETKTAVTAIKDIGLTINKISEISAAIASAVEEQNAATKEISRNVQEASTGTTEVSSNIVNVKHAAEITGKSASVVLDASSTLSAESTKLKEKLGAFLRSLKAG